MSIPVSQPSPEDPRDLPPARRRRAQRHLIPEDLNAGARDMDQMDQTARRTSPGFDFFLFTLLSAAVLAVGIVLDAPALMVLGVLAAPVLSPVVGIALSAVTGSLKLFMQRFAASLIAFGLVFGIGLLGGYAARIFPARELDFAIYHAQISWSHLVLLGIGTILSVIAISRKTIPPFLPSTALAYELFIPLSAAGYGLGKGVPHLWPDGLVVFATHFAILILLGTAVFLILGYRPLTILGYTFGSVITILGVIVLIGLTSAGAILGGDIALPTPSPTPTLTLTPIPPTETATLTPVPPTTTPTATSTLTPTLTVTSSPSPSPTPIYAIINAGAESGGAVIRKEPGYDGEFMASLLNGNIVQIINPTPVVVDGRNWIQVRLLNDGREGWILESLLLVATPNPDW